MNDFATGRDLVGRPEKAGLKMEHALVELCDIGRAEADLNLVDRK